MSARQLIKIRHAWAIVWRSVDKVDGDRRCYVGAHDHPCGIVTFETRKEARVYIVEKYGYIAKRPDLRAEPYGWRMPTAERIQITVKLAKVAK